MAVSLRLVQSSCPATIQLHHVLLLLFVAAFVASSLYHLRIVFGKNVGREPCSRPLRLQDPGPASGAPAFLDELLGSIQTTVQAEVASVVDCLGS